MKTSIFAALLGLAVILGGNAETPALASNKGEPAPENVSPEQTPASEPAADPDDAGSVEKEAEAPQAAEPTPAPTPGAPVAEPGDAPPSIEGNGDATRPELPAISEDSDLETVREDDLAPGAMVSADMVSPATLAFLRALETRHASVVTVKGSFDQLKVSEIFLEEIRSKGTFWYKKPDHFRCDYEPPDEMTNLILKDSIYVYVPSIEQCEIYRFRSDQERDQQLHSMVLGFGFKTDELLEAYTIQSSESPGALRDELTAAGRDLAKVGLLHLTPLPGLEDTSPFTSLKLWIDKGSLLPEKVWFEDYNGDKTTIEIRSIDLNGAVDPKLFAPSFPPGTEFIDKSESQSEG